MLSIALLVFRETLEAALLIGIIAAATKGVPGRNRWVMAGIAGGTVGAILVAALTGEIASLADGMGTDLFNAAILATAILMLGWHSVWMASHGRALARDASRLGETIRTGSTTMSVAAIAIAMAVLREGAETVLFLYGITSDTSVTAVNAWSGGALGLVGGTALGFIAYAGIMRVPMRRVFAITGALIMLLAASMAAQLARTLIQADLLPAGITAVWDTTGWLPMESVIGSALHALVGYDARPSSTQLLFYCAVIAVMFMARHWAARRNVAAATQQG
jgi:high-affinity iron transporter